MVPPSYDARDDVDAPAANMSRRQLRNLVSAMIVGQLVIALLTGVGVFAAYRHFDHNIRSGGEIAPMGGHLAHSPNPFDGPLNILVMGNDSRDCAGCHIDDQSGAAGSDTTILFHIYADHRSAVGVSIPRDLLVKPIPCTKDLPEYKNTGLREWNEAFTGDHPECTADQVQDMFGVRVNDYVSVNFGGFKGMVDALHGVQVCLTTPINDDFAHIHLPTGTHTLTGGEALEYVRERHDVGDGSDIGRMRRQQAFIASLIKKVVSASTLTQPTRILGFADALTSSLETNPEIAHASSLVRLGVSLRHIRLADTKFLTLPSTPYDVPEGNPYWGRLKTLPDAGVLWQKIRHDQPIGRFAKNAITADKPNGSKADADSNRAADLCG
jgi:LCP family protein required for cell wall assembly